MVKKIIFNKIAFVKKFFRAGQKQPDSERTPSINQGS